MDTYEVRMDFDDSSYILGEGTIAYTNFGTIFHMSKVVDVATADPTWVSFVLLKAFQIWEFTPNQGPFTINIDAISMSYYITRKI